MKIGEMRELAKVPLLVIAGPVKEYTDFTESRGLDRYTKEIVNSLRYAPHTTVGLEYGKCA